jgi:hypothetical protein
MRRLMMNLKDYLKMTAESNGRQNKIYIERNKNYATDDDVLKNSWMVTWICQAWEIEPMDNPVESDWFRLVDKLTRERNCHKRDNLDDAMNYLRRIMAHYGGK